MSSNKSEAVKPKPPRIPPPIDQSVVPQIFADGYMVGTSVSKDIISLCFLSVLGNKAFINSRYILTPVRVKKLIEALKEAVEECEEKPSEQLKTVEK